MKMQILVEWRPECGCQQPAAQTASSLTLMLHARDYYQRAPRPAFSSSVVRNISSKEQQQQYTATRYSLLLSHIVGEFGIRRTSSLCLGV
jgi:hypothetical protein